MNKGIDLTYPMIKFKKVECEMIRRTTNKSSL